MQNTNCFWEEIPMYTDKKIWLAQGEQNLYLLPAMANRHGLIAGATGTGKSEEDHTGQRGKQNTSKGNKQHYHCRDYSFFQWGTLFLSVMPEICLSML